MNKFTIAFAALLVPCIALAQRSEQENVLCDLVTRNCLTEADQLRKEIRELKAQLKKGEKTHSAQEQKRLRLKLKEAEKKLDQVAKTPSSPRPSP